ncbi:hypothetical protein HYU13_01895 [Candidatus Woesearchaeota archaeon]|nr:hypothetical protein [Candidatus Woesearchaeota archaeon]
MAESVTILLERKGRRQFSRFMELMKESQEIPIREIRAKIPKSTFYEFILVKIFEINESIKRLDPEVGDFIVPSFSNTNGKIIHTFKRNGNVEIDDSDPNFFLLKVREASVGFH